MFLTNYVTVMDRGKKISNCLEPNRSITRNSSHPLYVE